MMTPEKFKKVLDVVMQDWERLASDRRWVSLHIDHLETVRPVIHLSYGVIHSNGAYECRLGYLSYYIDKDEKVWIA